MLSLPRCEIIINFAIWIFAVFYALYNFFNACKIFDDIEDIYNDFAPGWKILNHKKDIADSEWNTTYTHITSIIFWLIIHSSLSEWLQHIKMNIITSLILSKQQLIPAFHLIISFLYIYMHMQPIIILIIVLQPCMFLICLKFENKLAIWLTALFCLTLNTFYKYTSFEAIKGCSEEEFILSVLAIFWINLRCLSYFLDKYTGTKGVTKLYGKINLLEFFAYCFYLPLLFCGPFVLFEDYSNIVNLEPNNFQERLKKLIKNLVRVVFWMIFTEFALHFIYVNPMAYQIDEVRAFDSWTIYGYGYAMGQFFHLKYIVIYGFSLTFAEFEGVMVPRWPKCIGRIHLYSDMWKYFDEGFYKFTLRYIYIPLTGQKRTMLKQLLATFVCFAFVYVWHGIESSVLMWALINFICVTIERLFSFLGPILLGMNKLSSLSESSKMRLHGIIASPLVAISAMSNSYFFGGKEVGDAFFAHHLRSDLYAKCTLYFFLYNCCQVSMEVKRHETKVSSVTDNSKQM